LTAKGREQVAEAATELTKEDFIPTFIWVSNTQRAYETATILANIFQIGQNRIVPEFSFLDARGAGEYEGKSTKLWEEIHHHDEVDGIKYKPAPITDGTSSDSVMDVLVRGNQLVSTLESMYSGENVIVVSPDSEILSILEAAMSSEDPDEALLHHANFAYHNAEFRRLNPLVKPPEVLITGQTQSEADAMTRKVTAMRLLGEASTIKQTESLESWYDLWERSIDNRK
jgi:broad specificity phosphatase PhoE